MSATLLDINVLVALAWPSHIHHERAHAWFRRSARSWATCPGTQSGFVRVSSHDRVLRDARSPTEAILLLRQITALPGHEFWIDDVSLATADVVAPTSIVGHRQVSDAHLLTLAVRRKGRLATFDRGIATLARSKAATAALEVIPAGP